MTGNPVTRGNDGGGMDMGPQAVILRGAVRCVDSAPERSVVAE